MVSQLRVAAFRQNVEVHGAPITRPATSLPHLLLYGIPLRRFTLHAFCFHVFGDSILCLTLSSWVSIDN